MTAKVPDYQRTYYRRTKAERYRKDTERRQRQREADALTIKSLLRAHRERRDALVQAEHELRRQRERELADVLKGGLDGR